MPVLDAFVAELVLEVELEAAVPGSELVGGALEVEVGVVELAAPVVLPAFEAVLGVVLGVDVPEVLVVGLVLEVEVGVVELEAGGDDGADELVPVVVEGELVLLDGVVIEAGVLEVEEPLLEEPEALGVEPEDVLGAVLELEVLVGVVGALVLEAEPELAVPALELEVVVLDVEVGVVDVEVPDVLPVLEVDPEEVLDVVPEVEPLEPEVLVGVLVLEVVLDVEVPPLEEVEVPPVEPEVVVVELEPVFVPAGMVGKETETLEPVPVLTVVVCCPPLLCDRVGVEEVPEVPDVVPTEIEPMVTVAAGDDVLLCEEDVAGVVAAGCDGRMVGVVGLETGSRLIIILLRSANRLLPDVGMEAAQLISHASARNEQAQSFLRKHTHFELLCSVVAKGKPYPRLTASRKHSFAK